VALNPFFLDRAPVVNSVISGLGRADELTDNPDFAQRSDRALYGASGHACSPHNRRHSAYSSVNEIGDVKAPVKAGLCLAHA